MLPYSPNGWLNLSKKTGIAKCDCSTVSSLIRDYTETYGHSPKEIWLTPEMYHELLKHAEYLNAYSTSYVPNGDLYLFGIKIVVSTKLNENTVELVCNETKHKLTIIKTKVNNSDVVTKEYVDNLIEPLEDEIETLRRQIQNFKLEY